jgi:hypothetical protein
MTATTQHQHQRDALGLEVDAGPDGQPVERAGPFELVTDGVEEPALADDPVDARGAIRSADEAAGLDQARSTQGARQSGASNGGAQ